MRVWDARASGQKSAHVVPTKGENINISWSPDGNTIAVGNKEDVVSFIDARTYKVIEQRENNCEINEIKWNNDGNQFYMTTGEGTLLVLDYPSLKETMNPVPAHSANCICIEFDPKGR